MTHDERAAVDRARAAILEVEAAKLKFAAACIRFTGSFRLFAAAVLDAEAREFWNHPDVLEADVAAEAWYGGQ